mmetsp:Transcript_6354/g.6903  ORF Transcript_6354/g.6903 Transcript_6354/m.6903 type:complete len:259 (+) Transcript_6354:129-905(+)
MQQSVITQVRRDSDSEDCSSDTGSYDDSYYSEEQLSFWQRLCCCFNKHSTTYEQDNSPIDSTELQDTGPSGPLLSAPPPNKKGKICCVLDLDETLVHSSFKAVPGADYVIPIEIENVTHKVYVMKRPFVDEFLQAMGEIFEVVIFTASIPKYADPVLDLLDKHKVITGRLTRESCSTHKGNYVKDMTKMGRAIERIFIIDNSPHSYLFQPENAIPCESWFDDQNDTELRDLIPHLRKLAKCSDVIKYMEETGLNNGIT